MPAWSTEIAAEFVQLGLEDGRAFDQMQLQKLVYIAHGWCLAITGNPLTGDRPEAWDFGPMYRRLADALRRSGREPITSVSDLAGTAATKSNIGRDTICSELDHSERALVERILLEYGAFSSVQLSALTRSEDAPWTTVYRSGEGRFRDISHNLIRDQFVRLAQRFAEDHNHH